MKHTSVSRREENPSTGLHGKRKEPESSGRIKNLKIKTKRRKRAGTPDPESDPDFDEMEALLEGLDDPVRSNLEDPEERATTPKVYPAPINGFRPARPLFRWPAEGLIYPIEEAQKVKVLQNQDRVFFYTLKKLFLESAEVQTKTKLYDVGVATVGPEGMS